jgi:alpha/beta superfamily hydrolase
MSPSPPAFPDAAGGLLLPGPAGAIELACDLPEVDVARAGVAIICHPHPLHGGTMRNKVVTIVERALLELGLATVRFNFRGVGRSEGEHDNGVGETEDVVAIAQWLRTVRRGDALWLAGFSFGSYVTLLNAVRLGADALISIAPPAAGRSWDFSRIDLPACPWLVVMGDADEIVEPQAVYDWVDSLPEANRPQFVKMEETSHFFHRRLMDLRGVIKNAVKDWLPGPRDA